MPAPPARTEISDTYPNPSNAVARTGFGKLWDYATTLLGASGTKADACTALGAFNKEAGDTIGGTTHGTITYKNSSNTVVVNAGVNVTPGTGIDSFGFNLANTTGSVKLGNNGITRLQFNNSTTDVIHAAQINLTAPRCDAGVADFRLIGTTTSASAANIFRDGTNGRLYVSTSSARYKIDIEDLPAEASQAIYSMRPITYRSLADADRKDWVYYGLIAEELAKVAPRLVHWIYPASEFEAVEDGKPKTLKPGAQMIPDGVQYERITVLLLAEVQALKKRVDELSKGRP